MSVRHLAALLGVTVAGSLSAAAFALPAAAAQNQNVAPQRVAAANAVSDPLAKGRLLPGYSVVASSLPTTATVNRGVLDRGSTIDIQCKVYGSSVRGNDIWYLRPAEVIEFVPARYVANVGPAPKFCGAAATYRGRSTAPLVAYAAPTSGSARVGRVIPRGTTLAIGCKVPGRAVGGNPWWYNLGGGSWVSARHVANSGAAPDIC